jgi:hypothetical protein
MAKSPSQRGYYVQPPQVLYFTRPLGPLGKALLPLIFGKGGWTLGEGVALPIVTLFVMWVFECSDVLAMDPRADGASKR